MPVLIRSIQPSSKKMLAFSEGITLSRKVLVSGITTITRNISKNELKPALAQTVSQPETTRDHFYQKQNYLNMKSDNTKPDGWNQAKPFDAIPRLKPLPIIGNNFRFMPGGEFYNLDYIEILRRLQQKFGNIVYLHGLVGKRPIVLIYDPEDFEKMMRNEGPWPERIIAESVTYYRENLRNDVFKEVAGLTSVQGEDWYKIRSVANKVLMDPKSLEMYVSQIDEVAADLLKFIRHKLKDSPRKEMPESFQADLYKWALESIGMIAYNRRIGCLALDLRKDSEGQKFIDAVLEMIDLMYKLDILPSMWRYVSTRNWRRMVAALDYITEVNTRYINEGLAKRDPNSTEKSALERLVKADMKIAITMATDMLIGGIDTTGRTLGNALYFLAKQPEAQARLREEIKKVLPNKDSPVTPETLRDLPYLRAVIKETLRIAPVAISNERRTIKDIVLAGYQIPKGADIVTVNMVPSLDERNYPRPNEFKPERWLRTSSTDVVQKNVHSFVYLPFGFGPRSCVGRRVANMELEIALSKIIRNFSLSWNHPDAVFRSRLLYGIVSPLKVTMEEIKE